MHLQNPDEKLLLKLGKKFHSGNLREIIERSFLPFLPLDLKTDFLQAKQEMLTLLSSAEPISEGVSQGWSYISLFGPKYTTNLKTMRLLSESNQSVWNEAESFSFLHIKKLISTLPFEKIYSVQLLTLAPSGYVKLHSDNFKFGLDTMVISLQEPRNCIFNIP